jgi:hypothetical protein
MNLLTGLLELTPISELLPVLLSLLLPRLNPDKVSPRTAEQEEHASDYATEEDLPATHDQPLMYL